MNLSAALGIHSREVVALVGAGGKTAALYRLAHELLVENQRVLATTTTHMRAPGPGLGWPLVVEPAPEARLQAAAQALAAHGRVLVAAGRTAEDRDKLCGVPPAEVPALAGLADVTLIEADGARGLHLKAPAGHEPVIPAATTLVVPVVGLQAVGQPLGPAIAHRPELVGALLGLAPGAELETEHLAAVLLSERGGLKGVPAQARIVPLINQADQPEQRRAGRQVARAVLRARGCIRRAVVASLQQAPAACECWQPSAAIVLAAGAARRFGRLKQAQLFEGRPLLARVVEAALSSLATEVAVVLGCGEEQLAPLLGSRPCLIRNPRWAEGLSTSVQAGLAALAEDVQAAVFLQADQPLLTPVQIDELLACRAEGGANIVAWRDRGEMRSPLLFARPLFAEFAALTGDVGGRAVARRHAGEVAYIDVQDRRAHADVDTPEDLARLESA